MSSRAGNVAAGSAAEKECRGPGRYESGKEGSYRPCCDGLSEVSYKKSGYTRGPSGEDVPTCGDYPLRVYACVRGECGDGSCEAGESPACGCVADCPEAAWEKPAKTFDEASGLAGLPRSCGKDGVLAELRLSPDTIECGDLLTDASSAAKAAAVQCARDAVASSKPFRLFWKSYGTDSLNHSGLVARLEDGVLHTYVLRLVPANSFGSSDQSENAIWFECKRFGPASCKSGPDECLACTSANDEQCTCSTASGSPIVKCQGAGVADDADAGPPPECRGQHAPCGSFSGRDEPSYCTRHGCTWQAGGCVGTPHPCTELSRDECTYSFGNHLGCS